LRELKQGTTVNNLLETEVTSLKEKNAKLMESLAFKDQYAPIKMEEMEPVHSKISPARMSVVKSRPNTELKDNCTNCNCV
jgi:hypothetical protein